MKDFPITMGIDDARFELYSEQIKTQLIGVVCQGTRMIKVLRREIDIDGADATSILIEMIKSTEKHVQYILTDAITFGGFNIYDMKEVYEKTGKPIIAITDQEVDIDSVKKALVHKFEEPIYKQKLQYIWNAGNLFEAKIPTAGGYASIFYHCQGIHPIKVEELLEKICIDSKLPEPIRMAHLIGKIF